MPKIFWERKRRKKVKPLKGFKQPNSLDSLFRTELSTVKGMIGLANDRVETFRRSGSVRSGQTGANSVTETGRGRRQCMKPLKGFKLPTVKGMIGLADDRVETLRRSGSVADLGLTLKTGGLGSGDVSTRGER
jgi:hypothetical protein